MKSKLLFLCVIIFASGSQAMELMKCYSQKNGTLWASFGRYTQSGKESVFFPTEIVHFSARGEASRKVYMDMDEALKVDVLTTDRLIRLGFTLEGPHSSRKHELKVLRYDADLKNAYQGNWTFSEDGNEVMDLVGCTVD